MKIALIANPDIAIPVEGYGGLERQVQFLAEEYCRQGHEVTIFGNVGSGGPGLLWEKAAPGAPNILGLTINPEISRKWSGVKITSQHDVLAHVEELRKFDVVHDRTKDKALRVSTGIRYVTTMVWSDQVARPAVYVSDAVRQFYKDPDGPVIPECVPFREIPDEEPGTEYACFGRIDPIKGTGTAVELTHAHGASLVVAGHVGKWGSTYYAEAVRKACDQYGFRFVPNPSNDEARHIIAQARGLVHTHFWLESFSEVVAEALCHGIPVLTTDSGAPKEWVAATGGGVVLNAADLEKGLFEKAAVERFFRPEEWSGKREEIAAKARTMFDPTVVAQQYLKVYEGVQ